MIMENVQGFIGVAIERFVDHHHAVADPGRRRLTNEGL
jgi:hypothetical protein